MGGGRWFSTCKYYRLTVERILLDLRSGRHMAVILARPRFTVLRAVARPLVFINNLAMFYFLKSLSQSFIKLLYWVFCFFSFKFFFNIHDGLPTNLPLPLSNRITISGPTNPNIDMTNSEISLSSIIVIFPLPNLFRITYLLYQRQCKSELWLLKFRSFLSCYSLSMCQNIATAHVINIKNTTSSISVYYYISQI